MNRLDRYARPLVKFDAKNPEHRKHYWQYLKNNTWGRCPVRFWFENETAENLIGIMERQILEYYSQQEFGRIKK